MVKSLFYKQTPSATEPVPCDTSNDLVIVLDSSGSIGPDDFEIALDFVARLAVAYLENINTRFSLIRYSTTADVIIPLQNAFGPDEIKRLVMNTTYLGGNTYTNAGINLASFSLLMYSKRIPNKLHLKKEIDNNGLILFYMNNTYINNNQSLL